MSPSQKVEKEKKYGGKTYFEYITSTISSVFKGFKDL